MRRSDTDTRRSFVLETFPRQTVVLLLVAALALSVGACSRSRAPSYEGPVTMSVDISQTRNTVRIRWGTNEKDYWDFVAGIAGENAQIISNYRALGNEVVRLWVEHGWNAEPEQLDPFVKAIVDAGSTPKLCIVKRPDGWSNEHLAEWVLTLLGRYNSLYDIDGWYVQLINEPNLFGMELEPYIELYNHVAPLVKEAYPDVLVGGPSPERYRENWIDPFLKRCEPIDFLEWHRYALWIAPDRASDYHFMDRTVRYGNDVDKAATACATYGRDIELHMGEYNLNSYWDPVDPRCQSIMSAAYTASVLRQLIDSPEGNTVDMEMHWEGTGGEAWGLWDHIDPTTLYPAFHAKRLFAEFCHRGDTTLTTASSQPGNVEALALATPDGRCRVFLICKRDWEQEVTLDISGAEIADAVWHVLDSTTYEAGGVETRPAGSGSAFELTLHGYSVALLDCASPAPAMGGRTPPGP